MKRQAVLVDVAIDQGGCFETSRPTTHSDPTFEVDGIIHYCVTNMPGAVPITSTYALTNATLPYVLALADHGVAEAARRDPGLRLGINVAGGQGHPPGGRRGRRHGVRPARGGARHRAPKATEPRRRRRRRHGLASLARRAHWTAKQRRKGRRHGNRDRHQAAELHQRRVRRSGRGRDRGRRQPGDRRDDRRGAALDAGGRRPRRRGRQGVRGLGDRRPRASARWRC